MPSTIQPTFTSVAEYLAGNSLMNGLNQNTPFISETKYKHIKYYAYNGYTIPTGKEKVSGLNRTDFFYALFFYNHNVKFLKNNTKTLRYVNNIKNLYDIYNDEEIMEEPNNSILLGKLYHYDEIIAYKTLKDKKVHFKIMGYSRKYGDIVISKTTSIYIHKLVDFCKEYNFSFEIIKNNKKDILKNYCPKTECSICLETNGNGRCVQLPCGHKFHKKCIAEWFNTRKDCPLCRTQVINNIEPSGYFWSFNSN